MLKRLSALLAAAAVLAGGAAVAQDATSAAVPAEPGSWEAVAGDAILSFVGGRSREEAFADTFNPYGIDGDSLLFTLGAFFVTTAFTGEPVHEGELSIYPQHNTPLGYFEPSEATPAIIPFALLKAGECHAGYVTGHPVPNATYAVALPSGGCHAAMVEEIVYAEYAAASPAQPEVEPQEQPASPSLDFDPSNPTDADLDLVVWAAYNGAYALAVADPDYLFIRDGNFDPVRSVIAAALATEGLGGIEVEHAATAGEAYGCAPAGTTVVRVAFAAGDAGITLVAASEHAISSYVYDPAVTTDLDIDLARACDTSGLGRTPAGNVP